MRVRILQGGPIHGVGSSTARARGCGPRDAGSIPVHHPIPTLLADASGEAIRLSNGTRWVRFPRRALFGGTVGTGHCPASRDERVRLPLPPLPCSANGSAPENVDRTAKAARM